MTAHHCPTCGVKGMVVDKRGDNRRVRCNACVLVWNTVERVEKSARTPIQFKAAKRAYKRRLTKQDRLAVVRGCRVPEHLEADWKTLKSSGYTSFEAAKALGLPFKLPRKGPRPVKNSGANP